MLRVGENGQAAWAAGSIREQVNQRVYELSVEHPGPFPTEFMCECGEIDCSAFVRVSLREYGEVRMARRPILAPGHAQA
jgi:hypothetical protein